MACEILDRRIGGKHPSVLVGCEPDGVINVHLDEVLVETVITANPATFGIQEDAIGDVDVCADKAREWLRGRWLRGQQIGFSLLRQLAVGLVTRKVREAGPFQDEGADRSNTVVGRAISGLGIQVEVVGRNTGGRVKCKRQVVCQVLRLDENSSHSILIVCEASQWPAQEIIACLESV